MPISLHPVSLKPILILAAHLYKDGHEGMSGVIWRKVLVIIVFLKVLFYLLSGVEKTNKTYHSAN
jgi:hypothetical protein